MAEEPHEGSGGGAIDAELLRLRDAVHAKRLRVRTTAATLRQAARSPLRIRERVTRHPLVFAGIAAGGAALVFGLISGSKRRKARRDTADSKPRRGFLAGIATAVATTATRAAIMEIAKRYAASRARR